MDDRDISPERLPVMGDSLRVVAHGVLMDVTYSIRFESVGAALKADTHWAEINALLFGAVEEAIKKAVKEA